MAPRGDKKDKVASQATKKTKKDGPKRPLSAYLFFTQDRRKVLIEQKPELRSQITEVSKLIGAEWKELSDENKEKYNKLAKEDRDRYEKEKAKL